MTRQRGQAAVESALVMPLSVLVILALLQLGLMEQAHLLTEYAAFQAARAGIVHHGDPQQMKEAAFLALLPTITRTYYPPDKTLPALILKLQEYQKLGMRAFMTIEAEKWEDYAQVGKTRGDALAILAAEKFDFIRIDTVAPAGAGRFSTIGSNVNPPNASPEIDFDDISSADAVRSNLLGIRLTYYYVMRVPLANWVLHNVWIASQAGVALTQPEQLGERNDNILVEQLSTGAGDPLVTAKASSVSRELRTLRLLSLAGLYVVPLRTTHTMRMQSNQFQQFMP